MRAAGTPTSVHSNFYVLQLPCTPTGAARRHFSRLKTCWGCGPWHDVTVRCRFLDAMNISGQDGDNAQPIPPYKIRHFELLQSIIDQTDTGELTQACVNETTAFKIATTLHEVGKPESISAASVSDFVYSKTMIRIPEKKIRNAVRKGKADVTPARRGRQKTSQNQKKSSLTPNTLINHLPTPLQHRFAKDGGCGLLTAKKAAAVGYNKLKNNDDVSSKTKITAKTVSGVVSSVHNFQIPQLSPNFSRISGSYVETVPALQPFRYFTNDNNNTNTQKSTLPTPISIPNQHYNTI